MNPFPIFLTISSICSRYHVEIMYIFGSRAHDAAHCIKENRLGFKNNSSDIDIGIKLTKDYHLPVKNKVKLIIEIEDLLKAHRCDLVVLNEADPFLAANIIRGERIYCENEYKADEYELYILRRAGDLAFLEKDRLSLIFGGGR